jgi:hypothetical protein
MYGLKEISREQAKHSEPANGVESGNSIALNFNSGRYDGLVGPLWFNREGQINAGAPDSPAYSEVEVGGLPVSFSDPVLTAGRGSATVSFNLAGAIKPAQPIANSPMLFPAHEGHERGMLILVRPSQLASPNRADKFEVWILLNAQASDQPTRSVGSP